MIDERVALSLDGMKRATTEAISFTEGLTETDFIASAGMCPMPDRHRRSCVAHRTAVEAIGELDPRLWPKDDFPQTGT